MTLLTDTPLKRSAASKTPAPWKARLPLPKPLTRAAAGHAKRPPLPAGCAPNRANPTTKPGLAAARRGPAAARPGWVVGGRQLSRPQGAPRSEGGTPTRGGSGGSALVISVQRLAE